MTAPAQPPSPEDKLYGLASAPVLPPAPAAAAVVPPVRVPRSKRVLAYQNRTDAAAAGNAYFPNLITDFYMPVVLLSAGIGIEFVAAWWQASGIPGQTTRVLALLGAEMVVGTVLMLAAVFFAAWRRGFKFGPFWGAVLKLSAVSIAPAAAMTLLSLPLRFIPLGGIINWVVGFCFYFALIGVFFELDQEDTWYCVAIIFLVNLSVALGAVFLFGIR
jgi:hypothetical protein